MLLEVSLAPGDENGHDRNDDRDNEQQRHDAEEADDLRVLGGVEAGDGGVQDGNGHEADHDDCNDNSHNISRESFDIHDYPLFC